MKELLLDTHVWLWFLQANARLPHRLRRTIEDEVDLCWLSPASVWEVGTLVARGRADLDKPLRAWVNEVMARMPLKQAVLTNDVAIAAGEIDLSIRDPADRFIAASALTYDLILVTVDEDLVRADWLETVSA